MEFMEYSIILNMLKTKVEEHNKSIEAQKPVYFDANKPVNLNIPDSLKLK